MAYATSPPDRDGFIPEADVDVWVDGWGSHHWWWSNLDTSDTIYVNVEVTSGAGIDFFICDQDNWNLWSSGFTASVYSKLENRGSISVTFHVPYSGTWHAVFYNDDLLTQKHIEGYIGLNPLGGADLTLILLILICVGAVIEVIWQGIKRIQQPKVEGYPKEMLPQISKQPIHQQPSQTSTNFCSYCGTPRQSTTSQYCATCGRRFDT